MNSDIPVGSVCSSIQWVDPLITQVGVKEVYEDIHKLGEGKKSVLFTCLFQNPDKTMTDEEALVVQERIIADMKKEGIELRH